MKAKKLPHERNNDRTRNNSFMCHCSIAHTLTGLYLVPTYWMVHWHSRERLLEHAIRKLRNSYSFFTARCYACAVLAMGLCPSVSLFVCVRVSQAGVLLKWQNVGSHKQHRTIHPGTLVFWCQISAKFDRGHFLRGHQMQVEWVKIGDFRQITGYISKTVQDRRMVSIKVE